MAGASRFLIGLVTPSLDIAKYDHLPQIRRQFGDGLTHRFDHLGPFKLDPEGLGPLE